mgnify:CR=1 FL=1|jgi:hypothetical protein
MKIDLKNLKLEIGSLALTKRHAIVFTIVFSLISCLFVNGPTNCYEKVVSLSHVIMGKNPPPLVRRDYISESIDFDPLDDLTQELADNYGCSYTNVNLFHNGITSTSGYKCKRMSVFSEGLGQESNSLMQELQNQVIEPFKPIFRRLKNKQVLYIPDVSKHSNPYFKHRMPQYRMNSIYYVAIYDKRFVDKNGKWHFKGFLVYAWDKPTKLSKSKLKALELEVERIIPIVVL